MFLPYKIKDSEIKSLLGTRPIDRRYYDKYFFLEKEVVESISAANVEDIINGTKLQEEWFPVDFPNMEFDIFISHSHSDVNKSVLPLASWFYEHFGLRCFIDSLYWQYADDLLKKFDNYYALNPDRNTYNYKIRNYTTSHVHIMLSMALMKMMDKTECVLFVDSDNSIRYQKGDTTTPSPWIYEEICFVNYLQRCIPNRLSQSLSSGGKLNERHFSEQEMSKIRYSVDLTKFKELKSSLLQRVKNTGYKEKDALDMIYYNTYIK